MLLLLLLLLQPSSLGHAPNDVQIEGEVEAESQEHKDIVQGSFMDTYFNNTIKTAMGLRWGSLFLLFLFILLLQ